MGKWRLNRLLEGNEKLKQLNDFPISSSVQYVVETRFGLQVTAGLQVWPRNHSHCGCARRDDDFRKRVLRLEEGSSHREDGEHILWVPRIPEIQRFQAGFQGLCKPLAVLRA